MAVEEIDDGEMGGVGGAQGCSVFGLDDDAFDVFVHGGAVDEDGVDAGREGIYREEKEGEEVLHNRDV